ncbi:uncharacterized protein PG998_001477 [Apiospora kogelbergensis]|uniref:uncharacterized protein n=1 Tax=Apiospora kogelbergensis TaxID=1337665 RepID=UPI00312E3C98
MERIIQEGVDEINEARKQDPWFDREYAWNPREQAWTRRPSNERLPALPPGLIEDKKKAKTHMSQVKSDIAVDQREVKSPAEVRTVRTHEYPLHHANTTQVHLQHSMAHRHGHHKKHMMSGQHPHHHSDNLQRAARKEQLQAQQPIEDYHPELDVIDKIFSDEEKKSLRHDPAQNRRPAQRPVFARVHSSEIMPARRHTPQLQRPVLHRTETYVEDLPKHDKRQQHHRHHHHPRQLTKTPARGPTPPRHKGGLGIGEHHKYTAAEKSVEDGSSRPKSQQSGAAIQDEEEEYIDLKERLRRAITDESNEEAVYSDEDEDEETPRAQPTALQQELRHDAIACTASGFRSDLPQQQSSAAAKGDEEEEEPVDPKELLRRAIMAEDNEGVIYSDKEDESETDDEQTRKAPSPPSRQQQQIVAAGPSSQSRACKQEGVRRRLLHAILPRGHKTQDTIQKEEEEEEAAPGQAPCVPGGSRPRSLLTQSLLAQRAAAEDDGGNVPDSMPTHHNQEHDLQQGPPYPLIVTTELCRQEAARCGVRVISEYIHDVPARLEAQKMATRQSKLRLADYVEMGRRTGLQLQRIDKEEEESIKAKDDKKDPKEGPGKDQKGKTQEEERLHYVSDYHYDHLREQPMPNCGWRCPW